MRSNPQLQQNLSSPQESGAETDGAVVARMLDQRQLRRLLESANAPLPAGAIVASIIYLSLQKTGTHDWTLAWLLCMALASTLRFVLNRRLKRRLTQENLQQTALSFAAVAFLGGASWAALLVFSGPETEFTARVMVVITMVGMPVAGLGSLAIYRLAFFAFATPLFVAMFVWAWWFTPSLNIEFTLITAAYVALVCTMANRYHHSIQRSIRREIENERLLHKVNLMNAELRRLAFEDPLTGLSNRRSFEESAGQFLQRLRRGDTLALMLIDVDGFKWVNDTLGHAAGDRLLIELSRRIDDNSRLSEMVAHTQLGTARIGGDEFIVVYRLAANAELERLATRILAVLTAPMRLCGQDYRPGVSIGVALAPTHANALEDLLRLADSAMYQAKSAGGSCFVLANPSLDPAGGMKTNPAIRSGGRLAPSAG